MVVQSSGFSFQTQGPTWVFCNIDSRGSGMPVRDEYVALKWSRIRLGWCAIKLEAQGI